MNIGKCFICLEEKRLWKKDRNGNRICSKCYSDNIQKKDFCDKCKIFKPIHKYIDSNPICKSCCGRYFYITEICTICGKINPVQKRLDTGPICRKCYKKNYVKKEICSLCGEFLNVQMRDLNNNSICIKCYSKNYTYKKRECGICKRINRIYKNIDGKDVCGKCYEFFRKKEICSKCGIESIVKIRKDGFPICNICYKKYYVKKKVCSGCNKIKAIYKSDKMFCRSCYNKERYFNDYNYRTTILVRNRINSAIKNYVIGGKIKSLDKYGIDLQPIIKYLLPFPENIKEYHIDHIIPVFAFDLNDPEQFKLAFLPENHQWLKTKENLQKGAKFNPEELEEFKRKMKDKYNL